MKEEICPICLAPMILVDGEKVCEREHIVIEKGESYPPKEEPK